MPHSPASKSNDHNLKKVRHLDYKQRYDRVETMRWVIILSFAVAGKPSAYLNTALSECDHAMIDLDRMKSPDEVVSHNI